MSEAIWGFRVLEKSKNSIGKVMRNTWQRQLGNLFKRI